MNGLLYDLWLSILVSPPSVARLKYETTFDSVSIELVKLTVQPRSRDCSQRAVTISKKLTVGEVVVLR